MSTQKTLFEASGYRYDGRLANELRGPKISYDIVPDAPGSVRYSIGGTSVIASVYFQTDLHKRNALALPNSKHYDEAVRIGNNITINITPQPTLEMGRRTATTVADFVLGPLEKAVSTLNRKESVKTTMVCILLLSDDGCIEAASYNAAVLAIVRAGIPLSVHSQALCVGLVRRKAQKGGKILDVVTGSSIDGSRIKDTATLSATGTNGTDSRVISQLEAIAEDAKTFATTDLQVVLDITTTERRLCAIYLPVVIDPTNEVVYSLTATMTIHPLELTMLLKIAQRAATELQKVHWDIEKGQYDNTLAKIICS